MYVHCPDVSPGLDSPSQPSYLISPFGILRGVSDPTGDTQMERLHLLPQSSSLSQSLQLRKQLHHLTSGSNPKSQQSALIPPLSSCPPGGPSPYPFVESPESSQINGLLPIATIPSRCEPPPLLPGLPQTLPSPVHPHPTLSTSLSPTCAQTLALRAKTHCS